jgi:predicted MPP superfamily phosphohydrolase
MLYYRIDLWTLARSAGSLSAGATVFSVTRFLGGSIAMNANGAALDSAPAISRSDRLYRGLLYRLFGSGWPAALAYRLGFQRPVVCQHHRVTLATRCCDAGEYDAGEYDAGELRIAFASDFHAGPTTHPRVHQQACAALAAAEADVLLLGGDFVSLRAEYVDELTDMLACVPAPLGKFAVLGNHDIWADRQYVTQALEAAGVQVLVNQNVRLAAPHDDFWICGLDEHLLGQPDAAATLRGADGRRIVLMHSPSGLVDLGNNAFELALCGHTHGGQIALPGGRPIIVPRGPLCRQYAAGRFDLDSRDVDACDDDSPSRVMIVSRGIGCSTLPVRIFSDPEVMVCRLVGAPEVPAPVPAAAVFPMEAVPYPDALGASTV